MRKFNTPLSASEDYLYQRYGEDGFRIACEIVSCKKDNIKNGFETDWSQYYESWDDMSPTENQISILESNDVPYYNKSKAEVSVLIDWIFFDKMVSDEIKREEYRRKRDVEKYATTSIKTIMNRRSKIADIWNEILADDKLTCEEVFKLRDYLIKHKIKHEDFKETIDYITDIADDGVIDSSETVNLYYKVEDCIRLLERYYMDKTR